MDGHELGYAALSNTEVAACGDICSAIVLLYSYILR